MGSSQLDLRRNKGYLIQTTSKFLSDYFKYDTSRIKCVWLCDSLETYKQVYGYYYLHDMIEFKFNPNRVIILSDLGPDGVLLAYCEGEVKELWL